MTARVKAKRIGATAGTVLAGLAVLAAAAACERSPRFVPYASVKQIMAEVLEPAADSYWDAVGSVSDKNGITEHAPVTDSAWAAVRNSATVIAESGNLLLIDPRARDRGEWVKFSRDLVAVGARARDAAEARDTKRIFDVGAEVYQACVNCHAKYLVPPMSATK